MECALQKQANHRVVTLVADKLERQWLWEGFFGIEDEMDKVRAAQFILQPY